MPLKKTVKFFIFVCLGWTMILCLSSCMPGKWAKRDVQELQLSAQRGDARAQVLIGEIYEFGAGVSANQLIAAQWYQMAANQDEPEAQFYLGIMYDRGIGLNSNPAEALQWLFKSAEQGHEKAQIALAGIYLKEKDLRQEFARRIARYRQNAEKGNAAAQYVLGWIYREGAGLQINSRESMKWYHKSAQQGYTKSQMALGKIYLEGKVAPANPSEAMDWYRKSAAAEFKARLKLCELQKGGGTRGSDPEAKRCSEELAQHTDASLRSYIGAQRAIIKSEKERNPVLVLRACQVIAEIDPAYSDLSGVCDTLQKNHNAKMEPRVQEARLALEKKDWNRFSSVFSDLTTPEFDGEQMRRLIAYAWQLLDRETRAREKVAMNQLRPLEAANQSAAYRKKNLKRIPKMIDAFKATMVQALRENPGDATLLALSGKGQQVIAGLQQKMKPPKSLEEKPMVDAQEKPREQESPGEDDYKMAQAMFDSGRFEEAAILFDKTTKMRGFKHIAQAYMYIGVSHLARINPANVNEARKLQLKGLASFQNALRFEKNVTLPAGYDKYKPVFDEAKTRMK